MRDPQASDALDPRPGAELERVFACADADSEWLGRCCRFLTYAGPHISILSGGYRQELVHLEDRDELQFVYQEPIDASYIRGDHLYWRRPKNDKPIGMPISRHVAPWLAEFLDAPRPRSRSRYNQLLARVGRYAGIHLNPLRFRHTCGVLLMHVYGMGTGDIRKLLGVTAETLATYVARPQWMVLEELRSKGW